MAANKHEHNSTPSTVIAVGHGEHASKGKAAREERRRTATWQDAAYHSVTGMVGAGVLGLPSTFVSLGWAGGIIALLTSFWVSWYTYKQLVYMHELPAEGAAGGREASEGDVEGKGDLVPNAAARDQTDVVRFDRYQDLMTHVFGRRAGKWGLMPFQAAVLVGIAITYTVVGAEDLYAVIKDYTPPGIAPALPLWSCFLVFAGAQLLLSLLPDFSALGVVSLLGALMSVGYCAIATGLAGAYRSSSPVVYANPLPDHSAMAATNRVIDIFAAISTILFAFGGHNVALEIQATLPSPPTARRMMRGVNAAFIVTGALYFAVSVSGFAALGVQTGPNIIIALTNGPKWVRNVARMFVVVHVLAAYQVYTHPVFDWIESGAEKMQGRCCGRLPVAFGYGSWASRLVLRTLYVAIITVVALLIPFFTDLMAFIGAVAITPTTFLLPPLLWLFVKRPTRWGFEWAINWLLVAVTGVVGLLGAISGLWLIVTHAGQFSLLALS